MRAYGDQGWFQVGDYGHLALFEFLTYQDPDGEQKHKVDEWPMVRIITKGQRLAGTEDRRG